MLATERHIPASPRHSSTKPKETFMSSNSIYSHYVYRITNLVENRHYYGIRSCKNRSPLEDLGVRYFSSATNKEFIKDQKQNPSYYKYKIIRACNSRKDAIDLEILLHEKFDVGANEKFYNKAKQTDTGFCTFGCSISDEHKAKIAAAGRNRVYGPTPEDVRKRQSEAAKRKPPVSEETRRKLSEIHKGREFTKERCENISKAKKGKPGKPIPDEVKKKMSESAKGKIRSEEHRKNLSIGLTGKNNPMFGMIWITDGRNNKKIPKDDLIPENFIKGRTMKPNKLVGDASPNYGRQWATNGIVNLLLSAGASMPEGYWRGRIVKQK
jgi:hypothetical protein